MSLGSVSKHVQASLGNDINCGKFRHQWLESYTFRFIDQQLLMTHMDKKKNVRLYIFICNLYFQIQFEE